MRVNAGKVSEIVPGKPALVQAGNKIVCVFHAGGAYRAVDELCPHRAGPLSEGKLEGTTITCPWHGASFDLTTGKALTPPATRALACYPVTVEGDDVIVDV